MARWATGEEVEARYTVGERVEAERNSKSKCRGRRGEISRNTWLLYNVTTMKYVN